MLTLKKYANGRLYDTVKKQYVTKDQLSELVENKEKIRVILAKNGKDVTKSVVSSLPTAKKSTSNGKNKPLIEKNLMKNRIGGHKKWIVKQVDKKMNTILEMMSFPNKDQVTKLNADVRKLSKKIDDLQKHHAKARKKMKLEHEKEMKRLIQQYDKPAISDKTEPSVQAV